MVRGNGSDRMGGVKGRAWLELQKSQVERDVDQTCTQLCLNVHLSQKLSERKNLTDFPVDVHYNLQAGHNLSICKCLPTIVTSSSLIVSSN